MSDDYSEDADMLACYGTLTIIKRAELLAGRKLTAEERAELLKEGGVRLPKRREQPNERLRRLRNERGLSLQKLADAAGLSKAHLWTLEEGRSPMEHASYITLVNIAAVLGISVNELMA